MLHGWAAGFLGLGERYFLVPVETVSSVAQDEARIKQTRECVVNSPAYNPNLKEMRNRKLWESCYGYVGYVRSWGGLVYSG